jgi:N-acetylglucosaminylphosphatidylinositol deacetylase
MVSPFAEIVDCGTHCNAFHRYCNTQHSAAAEKQIITFDRQGVSGHPNHIALSRACSSLDVEVYTLQSVPLWRKYLSVLDAMHFMRKGYPRDSVVYVASPSETLLIQKAMVKGHRSQMVWFRWGWLLFSRYQILNELQLEARPAMHRT